ncbi:MAG: type II secretion system minor pseudopilin GspH [Pseudomonadota bacterium]
MAVRAGKARTPILETGRPMRISKATRPTSRRPEPAASIRTSDAGFSMVELMVVVFIIGLVASFIVLSAPAPRDELEQEAQRVSALLQQAADEALVSGQPYGIRLEGRTLQVVRLNAGVWQGVTGAQIALSSDHALNLVSETDPVAGDSAPAIWFDPSGMAQPATMELSDTRDRLALSVSVSGEVTLMEAVDARR